MRIFNHELRSEIKLVEWILGILVFRFGIIIYYQCNCLYHKRFPCTVYSWYSPSKSLSRVRLRPLRTREERGRDVDRTTRSPLFRERSESKQEKRDSALHFIGTMIPLVNGFFYFNFQVILVGEVLLILHGLPIWGETFIG